MAEKERAPGVCQLWPLLAVVDIRRSVRFYCDQLGFTLAGDDGKPGEAMGWCRLERGGSSIMLQQSLDEELHERPWGRGVCFYFVCDDVDAIYAELLARGLPLQPPREAYYGMKQLLVPEPDGYALYFESPVRRAV